MIKKINLFLNFNTKIKNFLFSGISNLLVQFVSIAVNLISVPLTLNYLGNERYGIWLTITSMVALFSFLDFGLGSGLVNEISDSIGKNNKLLSQKSVSTTFFLLLIISSALLLIDVLFNGRGIGILFKNNNIIDKQEVKNAIQVLFLFILINIPLGIIQRIYFGFQLSFKYNIISLIGVFINLILILVTIHFKGGLLYLVLSINVGTFISVIISGYLLFKKFNYLIPRIKYFDYSLIKDILSQGSLFFLMTIFTIAAYTTDNFIISNNLSYSDVTRFDLVKKIFTGSAVVQFFIIPMWPMFNESLAAGNYVWSKSILIKMSIIALSACGIFALPLLFFGNKILFLWTHHQYDISFNLFLGFYFFILISTIGGILSSFLSRKEFLKKNTIFLIITSVSSVLFKILLIKKFGITSIVWSTSISYLIFYIIPSLFLVKNYFKQHIQL